MIAVMNHFCTSRVKVRTVGSLTYTRTMGSGAFGPRAALNVGTGVQTHRRSLRQTSQYGRRRYCSSDAHTRPPFENLASPFFSPLTRRGSLRRASPTFFPRTSFHLGPPPTSGSRRPLTRPLLRSGLPISPFIRYPFLTFLSRKV